MGHVMVTSELVSDVVFQAPLENWSGGHVFPGFIFSWVGGVSANKFQNKNEVIRHDKHEGDCSLGTPGRRNDRKMPDSDI